MTKTTYKASQYNKIVSLFCMYAFCSKADLARGIFILFLLEKGFSYTQLGMIQFALFFSNLVFEIPSGLLADKFSRKALVLVGLALMVANSVGMVIFDTFAPFLILFALQGISIAMISGADEALLYDNLKSLKCSKYYLKLHAKITSLSALSLGIALFLSGFIQKAYGWNAIYLLYAALSLVAMLSIALIKEFRVGLGAQKDDQHTENNSILKAFKDFCLSKQYRNLRALIFAFALFESALTPYYIFAQDIFTNNKIPIEYIGIIYCVAEILSAGTSLIPTRMEGDAPNLRKIMLLTMVTTCFLFALNFSSNSWVLVLAFLIAMSIPDVMQVLFDNYLHSSVRSKIRASVVSMISFLESVIIGLMYLLYGFLGDFIEIKILIAYTAIVPLICVILVCRVKFVNVAHIY